MAGQGNSTENEVNRARIAALQALTGLLNTLRDCVSDLRDAIQAEAEARKRAGR
jgi:hypothetical protein